MTSVFEIRNWSERVSCVQLQSHRLTRRTFAQELQYKEERERRSGGTADGMSSGCPKANRRNGIIDKKEDEEEIKAKSESKRRAAKEKSKGRGSESKEDYRENTIES